MGTDARAVRPYISLHVSIKKEKSTRQVLNVLRVDFNYSNALWIAMPSQKCGIAFSGIVRLAATSLESVELVNKALLERNSDHDAGMKRVLGYGETLFVGE